MPSIDQSRTKEVFNGLIDSWNHGNSTKPVIGLLIALLIAYQLGACVYRVWFHPLSRFPGPRLMSAIYLPYLYRNYVLGTWVTDAVELHRKYGPAVRIGPNHLALDGSIGWPEVFAHRPSGKAEYPKQPGFFFASGEHTIIGAPRETHRRQRRQLGHAFSDAALKEQESLITGYINLLLERLAERADTGKPVNIVDWFNFTTFDIIGDLTFADSFHSLENNGYHPWVLSIFKGIRGGALVRFFKSYIPFSIVSLGFKYNTSMKQYKQNRLFAIEKAKARMSMGAEPKDGRRDFMTYMLRKNREGENGMMEHEILATSPLLVLAGSETTATALSGLWFYLSQNPSAYKTLAEEVRSRFTAEADINLRTTASLEYLHACMEEILRIYPPAAETPPRQSPGDIINGHYVPEGTQISVYQWATFRNPAHFADPNSFKPERWLPPSHRLYDSRFQHDNKAVFKPFSHGSRDCIGKNLAYAEMRLITARMLYRFDYDVFGGQENWHANQRTFIVWEKGPLNIMLRLRDATRTES